MPDRESVRTRGKSENMGAAGRGVRAQNKDEVTRGMKMSAAQGFPTMPCAEGDETLVPGLPRALVERWAVIIHFLSPLTPYRHAALSQAQPAACTRRVRAARGSDPTPKVAPSTPHRPGWQKSSVGHANQSWTRAGNSLAGSPEVATRNVFCTIFCSSATACNFMCRL